MTAIEQCEELGRKAARASHERDQARVNFTNDYKRRFIASQPKEMYRELQDAYARGYKQEASEYERF